MISIFDLYGEARRGNWVISRRWPPIAILSQVPQILKVWVSSSSFRVQHWPGEQDSARGVRRLHVWPVLASPPDGVARWSLMPETSSPCPAWGWKLLMVSSMITLPPSWYVHVIEGCLLGLGLHISVLFLHTQLLQMNSQRELLPPSIPRAWGSLPRGRHQILTTINQTEHNLLAEHTLFLLFKATTPKSTSGPAEL